MFHIDLTFSSLISFYLSPVMLWVVLCITAFLCIALIVQKYPHSKALLVFEMLHEKIYNFYSDILWPEASHRVRVYIVTLFFVIFIANILSVMIDFIAPVFWASSNGDFYLARYILIPTSDMQFNIALSLFSTLLLLYVQFGSLGFKKFFYNYLPVWGKGYIEVERGRLSKIVYYPLLCIWKIGDILISLFLGFLDLVWLIAKVISLAFRLFWNMTSGTILLGMLIVWVSSFSQSITGFIGGVNFPILLPLLVYAQWLLVAIIQAMVFPLLVAIFIRMAMMEAS